MNSIFWLLRWTTSRWTWNNHHYNMFCNEKTWSNCCQILRFNNV